MVHPVLETESWNSRCQLPGPGRGWRELASEHALASSQASQDGALYQAKYMIVVSRCVYACVWWGMPRGNYKLYSTRQPQNTRFCVWKLYLQDTCRGQLEFVLQPRDGVAWPREAFILRCCAVQRSLRRRLRPVVTWIALIIVHSNR